MAPQAGTDTVIELQQICTRFGSHRVHEGLDLSVRRGEILGLAGGSGSGKSVLLREMIGLQRPNSGQVRLFGSDLATLGPEPVSYTHLQPDCCREDAHCWRLALRRGQRHDAGDPRGQHIRRAAGAGIVLSAAARPNLAAAGFITAFRRQRHRAWPGA